MNDIKFYREQPEDLVERLLRRSSVSKEQLDEIKMLDIDYRTLLQDVEVKQAELNSQSKKIGQLQREKQDTTQLKSDLAKLSNEISKTKQEIAHLKESIDYKISSIPNIPNDLVIAGDEEDNQLIGEYNTQLIRDIKDPKNHWEILEENGLMDSNRATKISGTRFVIIKQKLAKLERALINYMLDKHTASGYIETRVPYIVNEKSFYGVGQFPKFKDQVYKVENENKYLISTAEVPLTNIHADEILNTQELPIKYVSHTPCFRSESDSAGRDVKGLIRLHQFSKVEVFQIVQDENKTQALEEILNSAKEILDDLKIPYRVVRLASNDLGFSNEMTYDIEVWMPGQKMYREISSCSSYANFQARRANIKHRKDKTEKAQFVTTLNGSSLAVDRTIATIVENYQTEDGDFEIPEVLQKYFK
jgi:seryl-tRNA synthetase